MAKREDAKMTNKGIAILVVATAVVCLVAGGIGDHFLFSSGKLVSIEPEGNQKVEIKDDKYTKDNVPGGPIKVTGKVVGKNKIKVTGENTLTKTTQDYKVKIDLSAINNDIGVGLGLLVVYDNIGKKLTPLYGGVAQYSKYWGMFGITPQLGAYGTNKKEMYAVNVNIMAHYRW
jgi:hypothetical protein